MWMAEGTVFLNDWPQLLVTMARAMLAGKNPPSLTMPPQATLTKANVNTYYSGTTPKVAPDLPAVDSYMTSYVPSSS
jgi:hypothetical protein